LNNLSIRPTLESEVHIIVRFIRELAKYERLSHECHITEELLRESLFGSRPYAETILALLDEEPIGFCLFFHNFSTFLGKPGLYLEDLYVKPDYRNLGVGGKLLGYLASIALERNCGRFEWSVLDWNEPAIAFYRKIGAEPMNDWTVQRMTGAALVNLARSQTSDPDV
jgi:GNAT superfamily N-acetyltransferase